MTKFDLKLEDKLDQNQLVCKAEFAEITNKTDEKGFEILGEIADRNGTLTLTAFGKFNNTLYCYKNQETFRHLHIFYLSESESGPADFNGPVSLCIKIDMRSLIRSSNVKFTNCPVFFPTEVH